MGLIHKKKAQIIDVQPPCFAQPTRFFEERTNRFSKKIWNENNSWKILGTTIKRGTLHSSRKYRRKKPQIVLRDLSLKSFEKLELDRPYSLLDLKNIGICIPMSRTGSALSSELNYICVQKGIIVHENLLIPTAHFITSKK